MMGARIIILNSKISEKTEYFGLLFDYIDGVHTEDYLLKDLFMGLLEKNSFDINENNESK